MSIEYRDTWPETPRLLWQMRHEPLTGYEGMMERVCVTCSGIYSHHWYRAHLRSAAHRANRGWWAR